MNNIIVDTDYSNQSNEKIYEDLFFVNSLSEQFFNGFKEVIPGQDSELELKGIFGEILLFAEKFVEISRKNIKGVRDGRPDYLFCETIRKMGNDADDLNRQIGKVWSRVNSEYKDYDGYGSLDEKEYFQFRDYIFTMIILNNIGLELLNRYFKDGKPLYKENNDWKYIIYALTLKILVDKIYEIFKK